MANFRLSLFLFPLLSQFRLPKGSSLDDTCSSSSCLPGDVLVRFPFRLVDKQKHSCGYPGFDLSCDDKGRTVMNLTESGEFIVNSIDYSQQTIHLKDPNGCTPRRLAKFTTSGSAFRVESYRNVTFAKCRPIRTIGLRGAWRVLCLSGNFSWVTIASMENQTTEIAGCWNYTTLAIPSVRDDFLWFSDPLGIIGLTWDHPASGSCEESAGICRFTRDIATGNRDYTLIYSVMTPLLVILMVVVYIMRRPCATAANSQPIQDPVLAVVAIEGQGQQHGRDRNGTGMDSPALVSYPKITISEETSSQLRGLGDDDACTICLLDYRLRDTVKIIPECDHYFHEDCLDRWLRTNATCPLCRKQQLRSTDPGTEQPN
ncbi:hypothetical protein MLD38_023745 [Melastoma candidum]|uniref:Uncharacterized protein n=1 Tax=Melastoma candidum TaxID=119954 RepID=A0ACB9NRR1_9MYRT|nr:hypothetical protein MLD38_023745 [Melastoma candidum]